MANFPAAVDCDRPIWDMWLSMHQLPAITVLDDVGLFTALDGMALPHDELARQLQVNARSLDIILGLVAAMGFVEKRLGKWTATPVARAYLSTKSRYYWGGLFSRFKNNPLHAKLLEKLRTPEDGNFEAGFKGWVSGELSQEVADSSAAVMHAHSAVAASAVAAVTDFGKIRRLLDVGGGSGVYCMAMAAAWPQLKADVMDLAAMCTAAQRYIRADGMDERVGTVVCDMFRNEWPTGYDALFFSNVFHDWDEATNRTLSRKAYGALPSGGAIYLHEMLMNDNGDGPLTTASFAILMLSGAAGRQYTLAQLAEFLESTGFVDVRSVPTCSYYSLVSARKP